MKKIAVMTLTLAAESAIAPLILLIAAPFVIWWLMSKQQIQAYQTDGKISKTHLDPNGYLRFNDSEKLVHRWVVEKSLGRELSDDEFVHHRDGNKTNNSIENLQVVTWDEHNELHQKNLEQYGDWHGACA